MMGGLAIVPDRTQQPTALFTELEHAMDWGLSTFGAHSFAFRWIEIAPLENETRGRAGST